MISAREAIRAKTPRNDYPNQRWISSEYSVVKVLENAARNHIERPLPQSYYRTLVLIYQDEFLPGAVKENKNWAAAPW